MRDAGLPWIERKCYAGNTGFFTVTGLEPLVISIKTGIVATILSFFFGIFAARAVMKLRPGARAVIDGFLTLPMILPPTVAGFFLLLIFSLRRPFGAALYENFSIKAVQTWLGCILGGNNYRVSADVPQYESGI